MPLLLWRVNYRVKEGAEPPSTEHEIGESPKRWLPRAEAAEITQNVENQTGTPNGGALGKIKEWLRMGLTTIIGGLILLILVYALTVVSSRRESKSLVSGERQLTTGKGPSVAPAWSPDGKNIVFHSQKAGNYDIWSAGLNSNQPRQLTSSPQDEGFPKWSPDGKHIAFIRFSNGAQRMSGDIYVMEADGSAELAMTNDNTKKFHISWNSGGDKLIYSEARGTKETFETDLWMIDINSKQKMKLVDGYKWRRDTDQNNLFIGGVSMNRQGTLIAFDAVVQSGERWIYIMDMTERVPKPIVTKFSRAWFPAFSPNGRWIVFHTGKGGEGMWLVNPDGNNLKSLYHLYPGGRHPTWSPDGKKVAFVRGHKENANIWVLFLKNMYGKLKHNFDTGNRSHSYVPI